MPEVTHDTQDKHGSDNTQKIDPHSPDPTTLAQFEAFQRFLAQQAASHEHEPAQDPLDSSEADEDNDPNHDTSSEVTDVTESPNTAPEASQNNNHRRAPWIVTGAVALVATVAAGGVVFANRGTPAPTPAAPAPLTPGSSPTGETQNPTPAPTETQPNLDSQIVLARQLLERDNTRFNRMDPLDRQLAVDGRFSDIISADNGPELAYPYIAGTDYTKNGQFASDEHKDLIDFNPVDIASRVALGETESNSGANASDILNQLTFAKAAAWGQVKTPGTRELDQNTAANMVSGYFYDPESADAQTMIEALQRAKTIKIFGPETYTKPTNIDSSSELRTHTFDKFGNLKYKVINYNDGNGKRYVVVTPVETEFTGPDPRGKKGDVADLTVVKWLVLKEGKGTENTQGSLTHIS